MASVLIVDDEPAFANATAEVLRLQDHTVEVVGTLAAARAVLEKSVPEVLVLDLMLPDGNGMELFESFTDARPRKIVIVTGHSAIKSLVESIAGDGVTYMKKPIESRDLLGLLNAVSAGESSIPEDDPAHFGVILGESEPMRSLYAQISQVAPTDSTAFIQGDSGTGKELVADAIHRASGRTGAFVPVNCGGLSKDLVSAQLFGYEKGSFTGATRRHLGFFERADKGTLFLDEITEMPIEMQTHLLRALETGRILRVGAEAELDVNARLIAATNRDPAQAVQSGALREDLYFRLRVFPIVLPTLRERRGDVPLLARHFLNSLNLKYGTNREFAAGTIAQLERHHWPGNVRELKHAVHRAYIMATDDAVHPPDFLENEPLGKIEGLRAGRSIADVERDLIAATLSHFGGNRKAAAASLGVSLKTLYNRLKEYEENGEPL